MGWYEQQALFALIRNFYFSSRQRPLELDYSKLDLEECPPELFALIPDNAGFGNAALPQYFEARCTEVKKANAILNMAIYSQALKVAKVLNNVGICPLFLKGTGFLLDEFYGDTATTRSQGDIDILLEEAELMNAVEALYEAGYQFLADFQGSTNKLTLEDGLRTALGLKDYHHHLLPMVNDGGCAMLELHTRPLAYTAQDRKLDIASIFSSSRKISTNGVTYRVVCPEWALVISVLGPYVTDADKYAFRLSPRALVDVSRIISGADARNYTLDQQTLCVYGGRDFWSYMRIYNYLVCDSGIGNEGIRPYGDRLGFHLALRLIRIRSQYKVMSNALDLFAILRRRINSFFRGQGKIKLLKRRLLARISRV